MRKNLDLFTYLSSSNDATSFVFKKKTLQTCDVKICLLGHDIGHVRVLGQGHHLRYGVLCNTSRGIGGNSSGSDSWTFKYQSYCEWVNKIQEFNRTVMSSFQLKSKLYYTDPFVGLKTFTQCWQTKTILSELNNINPACTWLV